MRSFIVVLALTLTCMHFAHAAEPAAPCFHVVYEMIASPNDCLEARREFKLEADIDNPAVLNGGERGSILPFLSASSRGPAPADRESSSGRQNFATYIAGAFTKASTGESTYGVKSRQTNGSGWGQAAEYRARIHGQNYAGILFAATPTNATLYVPLAGQFSWPIRRYEFDVLWTHVFQPSHRVAPWVDAGVGAIALDGGSASGWDRQAAFVSGAGSDVRLFRAMTLRAGLMIDTLKASTYGDPTYRSQTTIMVEPRLGLVWKLPSPFARR